jgi:GTP-binding protein EngB required for normal cell division
MNKKQQQIIDKMDKVQKDQMKTIEKLRKMLTQEKKQGDKTVVVSDDKKTSLHYAKDFTMACYRDFVDMQGNHIKFTFKQV